MLIVLGVGYAWVEVAGLTLMQRLVSDEVLARVFGFSRTPTSPAPGSAAWSAAVPSPCWIEGALVAVGACLPLLRC